jgi:hypothetical protein
VPAPTSIDSGRLRTDPIPPGTCGFPAFVEVNNKPAPTSAAEKPAPGARPAPATPPAPAPAAQHHHHHAQPSQPAPHPPPATAPQPPLPAPSVPVSPAQPPAAADPARPPVVPAPKPPVPPAPPAPPQGLSVQQAPAPQLQAVQALQLQEQRREEHAYENDHAAVAYARPPSPLPWEIAGGAAVLALVMAGGGVAGRARSRALARATIR